MSINLEQKESKAAFTEWKRIPSAYANTCTCLCEVSQASDSGATGYILAVDSIQRSNSKDEQTKKSSQQPHQFQLLEFNFGILNSRKSTKLQQRAKQVYLINSSIVTDVQAQHYVHRHGRRGICVGNIHGQS
jgi:hypothetical protein